MDYSRSIALGIFLSNFFSLSSSSCSIPIEQNKLIAPLFEKFIGTKKIKISNGNSPTINILNVDEIYGFCATYFEALTYEGVTIISDDYGNKADEIPESFSQDRLNNITVTCRNGYPYFTFVNSDEEKESHEIGNNTLSCQNFRWNLYEAVSQHSWCSSESNSYILALGVLNCDLVLLARICFNLQTMQLESIKYLNDRMNVEYSQASICKIGQPKNSNELGYRVEDYDSIMKSSNPWDQKSSLLDNDHDHFRELMDYRPALITQEEFFLNILKNFGDLLKINWWNNLLHGNWKRFTLELNKQSTKFSYDTITGVSGVIKEPYYDSSKRTSENQELIFIQQNESLPAYVWSYLKGREISEELVVIGYNSPFYEFFDPKSIIFCNNICNEFSWLKNVSSTFSYSTLGIIFCCTPEDVRNSGVLKGFPEDVKENVTRSNNIE